MLAGVNDWIVAGPSQTLDTFSAISERLDDYRDGLREAGITVEWMHFFWAAHVHHGLRASRGVQPLPLRAGLDFTIARLASSERLCATNVSVRPLLPAYTDAQWGQGMAGRLCPQRGVVACKWGSLRCSADTPRRDTPPVGQLGTRGDAHPVVPVVEVDTFPHPTEATAPIARVPGALPSTWNARPQVEAVLTVLGATLLCTICCFASSR